jgi:hypothetical protein
LKYVSTAKTWCSTVQRSMTTEMLWVSLEERSRTNSPRQRFHSQLFCKIVRYFCRTLYLHNKDQHDALFFFNLTASWWWIVTLFETCRGQIIEVNKEECILLVFIVHELQTVCVCVSVAPWLSWLPLSWCSQWGVRLDSRTNSWTWLPWLLRVFWMTHALRQKK